MLYLGRSGEITKRASQKTERVGYYTNCYALSGRPPLRDREKTFSKRYSSYASGDRRNYQRRTVILHEELTNYLAGTKL